ncbi:MAG: thiolase family protein [Deltaproteobacteria bacterium]|nr:thiolase family protein [Deltaproteobacteria bacterium]
MSKPEVFICSAVRTPIGSFQGALAEVPAPRLGAVAVKSALERAGLTPNAVDEVYLGNVLTAGVGQAPARQAALYAGLPDKVPCTTVGKVCGSGLMATVLGAKSILLGDAAVAVVGGMESMSNVPYLLPGARKGFRMGNQTAVDGMVHDGLWDPYKNFHMGNAGELCAREKNISREEQDAFARESYRRALAAQAEGRFKDELVGVEVAGRKGAVTVSVDEEPGKGDADKLPTLRPAFDKNGTITAANASKINDGAAALVLASAEAVRERGLKPLARVLGYGSVAQAPEWFTTAPAKVIAHTLQRLGLTVGDIDLFEVNEAFAVVALAVAREAGLDLARVNVHGGAVALGHPIGASGARILVTLLHAMRARDARRGLATLCIGGGEAVAVVVERTT